MAVFRVEKNKGYTDMSNHHLRNKELSLKAKGLLSQMLSLPEDWDYTLAGLSLINRESIDAIRTAVWELEKAGYITRRQGRDEKGKMTAIEYTIYEQPQPPALDCPVLENPTADKPILENPTPDNPTSENPTQLNKEIQKTNLPKKEKLNTDISSTHSIPFHSLNPSPLEDAAQLPERKRKEATDAYSVYEEIIKDNIEYDYLIQDRYLDRDRIEEILALILETVCTKRRTIRIAGDDHPAELVKAKFMKLNSEHIRFVLDCMQKQKIKRQYAKTVKKGGAATAKATAGASQTAAKKAAAFVGRHPAGVIIAIAALLLFIMVSVGLSSCGAMFSGSMNSVLGTSYTSEDSDLVATEQSYAAMENELQSEIDNIETTHSGYDEYRYDLDTIGHNPHELASYLTALLQSYTPQSAQAELKRLFGLQYTLTLTEEIEIRTTTDEEGNEEEYEYRILNVKLTNKPIASLAEELLNPQQFEMFKVYLQTQGNKPLIFGGGSPDGSPSEDLSGVEFVNGTRPGNPEFMELAKQQVGNVGGYPYWSWYGFNSRVEWCACFVSWCYNQAGKSEPRFAGCEWQGVPWFQSRGQWGARGYENIAPGDAIFFDWDLDGVADHVGLVLGRDGSRVYTVEGNSGDACKIKSYDLNYQCIKGYGLMNW